MKDVIQNIINGKELDNIAKNVLSSVYQNGPISTTDMEILSYLALYQDEFFEKYNNSLLNFMGVFFKDSKRKTLSDVVFGQYSKFVQGKFNATLTPVQADILKGISNNNCFSFSAPTSTGKSFIFIKTIKESQNDTVVIVPSRALINEYYLKLSELITDKSVNVLTVIDKINTKHAQRSVFIVTPERCRELFRQKDDFNVDLFLFDEAQLSNENSKRGLYFDSIVRRCKKAYPDAKFVFAHPFVKNPESQIKKNHFAPESSAAIQYTQKNVGQLFLYRDTNWGFYHFGIDKNILGAQKQKCDFNPILKTIENRGSVLIFISKTKIYNKAFLNEFSLYINLCPEIKSGRIDFYIEQLKTFTGGDTIANKNHYSQVIALLRRGIVIHHGSLPLQTRILIEAYTKEGHCRMCFATSTLEQGINMPFDVVYLDRLESSKPLSVKNLIGRAGRSTILTKFDFGYVIINSATNIPKFRKIINQDEELDSVSGLEKTELQDDDYNDFKEAIINNTYSDEFNLTEKDLVKLTDGSIDPLILKILNSIFRNDELISLVEINADQYNKLDLYSHFAQLYSRYLGRTLVKAEHNVLTTALKIILWRVYGKTFKNICWYRYSYVSKSRERELLEKSGRPTDHIEVNFLTGFDDIPDKKLNVYGLFSKGTKAIDVDYDKIMYDTYDYIDKLIGFKLSDIFYAAFYKYFKKTQDTRADRLAKIIKYGTDNNRYIWLLRYGLTFEDIEAFDKHIEEVSAEEIVFKISVYDLPEEVLAPVRRFLN